MDSHNFSSEMNSIFVVQEGCIDTDIIKQDFELCDENSILQFNSNDKLRQVESEVTINSTQKSVKSGSLFHDHNPGNIDLTVKSCENDFGPIEIILEEPVRKIVNVQNDLIITPKESVNISNASDCEITESQKEPVAPSVISASSEDEILKSENLSTSCINRIHAGHSSFKPIGITSVKSLQITKNYVNINKNIIENSVSCNNDEVQNFCNLSKKRSKAWKYFTVLNMNEAECSFCQKKIHGCNGSSNLLRHLRSQHANEVGFDKQNKLSQVKKRDDISLDNVEHLLTDNKMKKISRIWRYFTKSKLGVVKCNVCCRNIPYHKSNSFLLQHLRLKHIHLFKFYKKSNLSKFDKQFNVFKNKSSKELDERHKNLSELIASSVQGTYASLNVTSGRQNSNNQKKVYAIKKKSETWKYFSKFNSNKTKCNICGSVLQYKHGISSNLTRHLRIKHKNVHAKYVVCKSPLDEVVERYQNEADENNVQPDEIRSMLNETDENNMQPDGIQSTLNETDENNVQLNEIRNMLNETDENNVQPDEIRSTLNETDENNVQPDGIRSTLNETDENNVQPDEIRSMLNETDENNVQPDEIQSTLNETDENSVQPDEIRSTLNETDENNVQLDEIRITLNETDENNVRPDGIRSTLNETDENNVQPDGIRSTLNNDGNDDKNITQIRKYFAKFSNGEVNCNLCHVSLSHRQGSTFNLKCHLIMKHNNLFQKIAEAIYNQENENFKEVIEREKEIKKIKLYWKYFMKMKSGKLKCNLCPDLHPVYCDVSNALQHLSFKHNIDFKKEECLMPPSDFDDVKISSCGESVSADSDNLMDHSEFVEVNLSIPDESTCADTDNLIDHSTDNFAKSACEKSNEIFEADRTWKYFTKINRDKYIAVKCNLCDKLFSYTNNITLNLTHHLNLVHPNSQFESNNVCIKSDQQSEITDSCIKIEINDDNSTTGETSVEEQVDIQSIIINKSSIAWKYFSVVGLYRAECQFCKSVLVFSRRSLSNLTRHLKARHNSLINFSNDSGSDNSQQPPTFRLESEIHKDGNTVSKPLYEYLSNDKKLKNFVMFESNSIKCKICSETFLCNDVKDYNYIIQQHMQICHAEWQVVCSDGVSGHPETDPDSCDYNELEAIAHEVQSFTVKNDQWQTLNETESIETTDGDLNNSQNDTYKNVWKYFTKLTSVNVRCNFCTVVLSYRNNKKWNLYRHLHLKHSSKLNKEDLPTPRKGCDEEKTILHQKKTSDSKNKRSSVMKNMQNDVSDSSSESSDSSDSSIDADQRKKNTPAKPIFISRIGRTWSHFTKVDMGKATCNICHKSIHYRGTGSDILNNHLQKYHIENSFKSKISTRKNDNSFKSKISTRKNDTCDDDKKSDLESSISDDESHDDSFKKIEETKLHKGDKSRSKNEEENVLEKVKKYSSAIVEKVSAKKNRNKSFSDEVKETDLMQKNNESNSCLYKNSYTDDEDDANDFKTTSKVWTYFTKSGNGFAECDLCLSQINYKGRIINLIRHLQIIHSVVSLSNKTKERVINYDNKKSQLLAAVDLKPSESSDNKECICFTKVGDKIAKCKFCSKIISYKDGNIHNLLTGHLQKMHSDEIMNYSSILSKNIKIFESDDINVSMIDVKDIVRNPSSSNNCGDQNDMPSRKRSDSWLYYTKLSNDYAQCNICSKALSYKGGSIYNLTRHLFIKHDIRLLRRTVLHKQKTNCRDVKMMPSIFNICKKKSGTLSFYTKINRYLVKCKLCSKRFIYKGVNINRLINHLWSSHITRLIEFNNGSSRLSSDHVLQSNDDDNRNQPSSKMEDFEGNAAELIFKSMSDNIRKPDQGRKISSTWKYFTKRLSNDCKARCNICYNYFSYKNGNISNLSRHLLRNHGINLVKAKPKSKDTCKIEEMKNIVFGDNLHLHKTSLSEIDMKNFKSGNHSISAPSTDLSKSNIGLAKSCDEDKIWKYFLQINDSEVECKVCNEKITHEKDKLNFLRNHLFLEHKIQIFSYDVQPVSLIPSECDEIIFAESLNNINDDVSMSNSVERKNIKSKRNVFKRMKCKLCYRSFIFKGNETGNLIKHLNSHEKELPADENILLRKLDDTNVHCDNSKDNIIVYNSIESDIDTISISADTKIMLRKYFKNLNLFKNKCKICRKYVSSNIVCSHRITNDLSITYGIKRNKSVQVNTDFDEMHNKITVDHSKKTSEPKRLKLTSNFKDVNHIMNVNLFENKCSECSVAFKNRGYCSHSLNRWVNESQQKAVENVSQLNDQVKIEDGLEIITDALSDGENKIIIITDDGASPVLNYDPSNKNGKTSDEVSYHVIGVDGENSDDIQVIIYNFDPEDGGEYSDHQENKMKIEEPKYSAGDIQPCNKELEEQVKVILQELNNASVYSNQTEIKRKNSFDEQETPTSWQTELVSPAEVPLKQHTEEIDHIIVTQPDTAISEAQPEYFRKEKASIDATSNPSCRNSLKFIKSDINLSQLSDEKDVQITNEGANCSMDVALKKNCELPLKPQEIAESIDNGKTYNNYETIIDNDLLKDSVMKHEVKNKEFENEDVFNSSPSSVDKNNERMFEGDSINLMESAEKYSCVDSIACKYEGIDFGSGIYLQSFSRLYKINKNLIHFSNINYKYNTAKCNLCRRYLLFRRPIIYNLMTHLYLNHKDQFIPNSNLIDITRDRNGHKILDLLNCGDENNDCNIVKPRRKSPVWKYFINSTNFRATCKICRFNFSYKGGAVNNLGRHLRLRHDINVSSKNAEGDSIPNFEFGDLDDISQMKGYLMLPKKRSSVKLRSKTWNYFSKEPNDWAKCILCKKYLSYRSSTINNLTRHLRTVHSNIFNALYLGRDCAYNSNDSSGTNEVNDEIYRTLMLENSASRSRDEVLQECSYPVSERSTKKRKSVVWNYFKEVDRDSGQCNFCLKVISCKGGGTSNLSRHLRVKHGIWIVLSSTLSEQYEEQFLNPTEKDGADPAEIQMSTSEMPNDTIITHEQLHILKNSKPSNKKSKTWDFFVKETPERVACKICSKTLSYKCKAVHNLRRHLAIKHPTHIIKRDSVRLKIQVNNENESTYNDGENELLDSNKSYIDITDTSVVIVDEENPPPVRKLERSSRPKKSFVWNYFNELEYGIAKCNMCYKVLSFRGGGTNNLMRHLRSRHSILIDLQLADNPTFATSSENELLAEAIPENLEISCDAPIEDQINNALLVTDNYQPDANDD